MTSLQVLPLDAIIVRCDRPMCLLNVIVFTDTAAVELRNNHKCPVEGGPTNYHWEVTLTLVERMWEMLDDLYREYSDRQTGVVGSEPFTDSASMHAVKGKLRGYAEMVALFMSPYFRDVDEITREVMKRKKMKDAGEAYETPGIGSRRYETPPNEPNKYAKATQHQQPPPPAIPLFKPTREVKPPEHKLSADDISSIKDMIQMMPAEHLAAAYETTVDVIRYVAAH